MICTRHELPEVLRVYVSCEAHLQRLFEAERQLLSSRTLAHPCDCVILLDGVQDMSEKQSPLGATDALASYAVACGLEPKFKLPEGDISEFFHPFIKGIPGFLCVHLFFFK